MKSIATTSLTERVLLILILLVGGAGLVYGWRLFWFLTDDAYIAFRYISNAHFGYGYVWNVPPFLPVEGYTSFFWVALLDVVWRFTGIEPPASANWIALVFSYGTMLLGAGMIMRLRWHRRLEKYRRAFVALLVLFLLLNRTFLAWSSSGLETAMFGFLLCLWVYVMLLGPLDSRRACLGAFVAACIALTRPDGLIFCAATIFVVVGSVYAAPERTRRRRMLLWGLLPFGIVLIHEAWRLSFYGEWLPNTYYAKITGPWPQSGFRYLFSFALEYSIWFAGVFVLWAFVKSGGRLRAGRLPADPHFSGAAGPFPSGAADPSPSGVAISEGRAGERSLSPGAVRTEGKAGISLAVIGVVGALVVHAGYYTFIVGGDHFEYRVYAHLLPLIFVAFVWSLNSLHGRPISSIAAAMIFIALSLPVQWTHWAVTRDLITRDETHAMFVPIAPHWPHPFRWYARAFDRSQSWLISHKVCARHQEHKVFWQTQLEFYPSREDGLRISGGGYPVYDIGAVGVPSWMLPHVNIIDRFGLNDYAIARTPTPVSGERYMAHERRSPIGYIRGFRPNVIVREGRVFVEKRNPPMTGEYISEYERAWRVKARALKHAK
jgi:arabinofuranosyltransferase